MTPVHNRNNSVNASQIQKPSYTTNGFCDERKSVNISIVKMPIMQNVIEIKIEI